jgi:hypothetical protein
MMFLNEYYLPPILPLMFKKKIERDKKTDNTVICEHSEIVIN